MNNVQKINYGPLGADLRIIIDDDQKIWFVASDIAKILEYKDATHMLRGLDDDEQSLHKVERLSGQGAVARNHRRRGQFLNPLLVQEQVLKLWRC